MASTRTAKQRRQAWRKKRRKTPEHSPQKQPDYCRYITSAAWLRKRNDIMRKRGHRCESCGDSSSPLHLHHKHYRTLGRERREDLIVLCKDCHANEHEPDGVRQDDPLSREFREIIGS